MNYGSDSNKSDAPDVEDMIPVQTYEIGKNKGNSPDDINGRLPLKERHRKAIDADPDEYVWLRVRANDEEVVTKQRIYESGRGISLEHSERQELGLKPRDPVKYWIAPIENGEVPSEGKKKEEKTSDSGQQKLMEDSEDQYVWLKDTDSTTYHHIKSNGDATTVCGIDFSDHDHVTTCEPGGFLDECRNCARQESDEMSNRQLIESIAEMASFTVEQERSNYLTREQLIAIRERLLELEEEKEES